MENEIWMDVIGYKGLYEVSNLGRIKSLPRTVCGYRGCFITKKRILKSPINSHGYPAVVLYKNGAQKTTVIHLIVAYAFLDHTPSGCKLVVDHINGVKSDPRAENLRIVTNRFNCTLGVRKYKRALTSLCVGVYWNKHANKWVSEIHINRKKKYLGVFSTEMEASEAYQNALSKL